MRRAGRLDGRGRNYRAKVVAPQAARMLSGKCVDRAARSGALIGAISGSLPGGNLGAGLLRHGRGLRGDLPVLRRGFGGCQRRRTDLVCLGERLFRRRCGRYVDRHLAPCRIAPPIRPTLEGKARSALTRSPPAATCAASWVRTSRSRAASSASRRDSSLRLTKAALAVLAAPSREPASRVACGQPRSPAVTV